MNISIRTVLLVGFLGVGGTLSACSGLGDDPIDDGEGGEAGSISGGTGGTTGGTGSGASGGSAGTGTGGSAGSGDAYAPRSGPFKMLVYSRTTGFRHESISAGRNLLTDIADEQGFDVTMTESNDEITVDGLSQYEVVFFLNPTGDVFNAAQQQAFETWMTTKNGAFVGVHSATDTERDWAFYQEVTGQYYDLHGPAGTPGQVVIQDAGLDFPGFAGLPNPWQRVEEWYRFNQHEVWSAKPGFTILARLAANDHPVAWTREYANFRSFYTSLGHEPAVFNDAGVKQLLTGAILWAVRREHLYE